MEMFSFIPLCSIHAKAGLQKTMPVGILGLGSIKLLILLNLLQILGLGYLSLQHFIST